VVEFVDYSTNTPTSWQWNATNVTGTNVPFTFSNAQDNIYTFGVGNWSITLYASNSGGSDMSDQITFINVSSPVIAPPVSVFIVNETSGIAPTVIQFMDDSLNTPTTWQWNATNVTGANVPFTFSNAQDNIYTFGVGNWSITLYVTNSAGSDMSDQVTFINVSATGPIPTPTPTPVPIPTEFALSNTSKVTPSNSYIGMDLFYIIIIAFSIVMLASLWIDGTQPFEKLFASIIAFLISIGITLSSFSLALITYGSGGFIQQEINNMTTQQQVMIPVIIMQNTPILQVTSWILMILCFINIINSILVLIDYSRLEQGGDEN
jgi:hypothetical protein